MLESARRTVIRLSVTVLDLAFLASCGGGAGIAGDEGQGIVDGAEGSTREVLEELGVDTDVGPRTDQAGEPLADGANPLGSRIASLTRIAELAGVGTASPWGGEAPYFVTDDPMGEEPEGLVTPEADSAWAAARFRAVAAGDVDGNGSEEVLVAFLAEETGRVALRVVGDQASGYETTGATLLEDIGEVVLDGYSPLGVQPLDLVAGDLDGDGVEEIALAVGPLGVVSVFDDAAHDFGVLAEASYGEPGAGRTLRLAAGDLDADSREEVVVSLSYGAPASVPFTFTHDTWFFGADASATVWLPVSATTSAISRFAVLALGDAGLEARAEDHLLTPELHLGDAYPAVADLDGDALPEIAFGGVDVSAEHAGSCALLLVEDGRGAEGPRRGTPYAVRAGDALRVGCAELGGGLLAADLDGDHISEMLFQGGLYALTDEGLALAGDLTTVTGRALWNEGAMAAADFDGDDDGREEIAVLGLELASTLDESNPFAPAVLVTGSTTLHLVEMGSVDELVSTPVAAPGIYEGLLRGEAPALVDANVDDDSVVVEWSGEREVMFSEPTVVAVLASAPFYEGVAHAEGATVWGELDGTSSEHAVSAGGSVSVFLGVKVEPEAPIVGSLGLSATARVRTELSFDFTGAWSESQVQTIEYENPEGHDLVIFSTTPYDYYYYRVISSPDPAEVGEAFAVHVPRRAAVHHVDREYYNAHNGDAVDIDEAVAGHTIGDPWSYPSRDDRDAALAVAQGRGGLAVASSRTATCSASASSVGLSIELSSEASYSFGGQVSVAFETEVEIGKQVKAVMGAGVEAHVGYEYTVSTASGLSFGGAVGDIDPEEWDPDLAFTWGLFAYEESIDGQAFPVVTYWVE